mmetsp:Transcript_18993/g.44730  ORF Transcript_18993/g.44730 Transcript_18993/m.44730 type:complete len:292 (+) Transcript_18993:793-1668(+)
MPSGLPRPPLTPRLLLARKGPWSQTALQLALLRDARGRVVWVQVREARGSGVQAKGPARLRRSSCLCSRVRRRALFQKGRGPPPLCSNGTCSCSGQASRTPTRTSSSTQTPAFTRAPTRTPVFTRTHTRVLAPGPRLCWTWVAARGGTLCSWRRTAGLWSRPTATRARWRGWCFSRQRSGVYLQLRHSSCLPDPLVLPDSPVLSDSPTLPDSSDSRSRTPGPPGPPPGLSRACCALCVSTYRATLGSAPSPPSVRRTASSSSCSCATSTAPCSCGQRRTCRSGELLRSHTF